VPHQGARWAQIGRRRRRLDSSTLWTPHQRTGVSHVPAGVGADPALVPHRRRGTFAPSRGRPTRRRVEAIVRSAVVITRRGHGSSSANGRNDPGDGTSCRPTSRRRCGMPTGASAQACQHPCPDGRRWLGYEWRNAIRRCGHRERGLPATNRASPSRAVPNQPSSVASPAPRPPSSDPGARGSAPPARHGTTATTGTTGQHARPRRPR
jgi:hypothetical protein